MSSTKQGVKPLLNLSRRARQDKSAVNTSIRAFSSTPSNSEAVAAVEQQSASPPSSIDPATVFTAKSERKLVETRKLVPLGSRRRRAALQSGSRIPFEQLPYQCFQEARKILIADREDKVQQLNTQRARIARLKQQPVEPQNERQKDHRIASMTKTLEELKIYADINDPIVKKRYEDGDGVLQQTTHSPILHD